MKLLAKYFFIILNFTNDYLCLGCSFQPLAAMNGGIEQLWQRGGSNKWQCHLLDVERVADWIVGRGDDDMGRWSSDASFVVRNETRQR